MIALQELLVEQENLQLILMSATMPTRDLAEYWCKVGRRQAHQQRERQQRNDQPQQKQEADNDDVRGGDPGTELSLDHDWENDGNIAVPVEINIPGRTFPVQEFFLEDVLSMTGFVNEAHGDATDLAQVEADLLSLLSGADSKKSMPSATKSDGKKRSCTAKPPSLFQLETAFTCAMCNQSGFQCAEEFGTHVALCDGGGASMLDLENRVKSVDVSSLKATAAPAYHEDEKVEDDGYDASDVHDNLFDEDVEEYRDDEEECELIAGKWDGKSPFGIDAAVLSAKTTLTQQEMLTRYQTMYDDETINYDLILELIRYVHRSSYGDGAILIFFSGWADISEFSMLLESSPPFNDLNQFVVHPLHSGIPSKDQRKVFVRPPAGVRKIILATNIAETSLTIEDVVFVVDTGRAKEKSYDPHLKTSTLQVSWISQASAKQRKGRAGKYFMC